MFLRHQVSSNLMHSCTKHKKWSLKKKEMRAKCTHTVMVRLVNYLCMYMTVKHNMASQTLQKGKWDLFIVKVFAGFDAIPS